jgi:hypothetical protein
MTRCDRAVRTADDLPYIGPHHHRKALRHGVGEERLDHGGALQIAEAVQVTDIFGYIAPEVIAQGETAAIMVAVNEIETESFAYGRESEILVPHVDDRTAHGTSQRRAVVDGLVLAPRSEDDLPVR